MMALSRARGVPPWVAQKFFGTEDGHSERVIQGVITNTAGFSVKNLRT